MFANISLFIEDYEIEVENLRLTLKIGGRLQAKAFKVLENLKSETNSVKEVVSKLQKRADIRWLAEEPYHCKNIIVFNCHYAWYYN